MRSRPNRFYVCFVAILSFLCSYIMFILACVGVDGVGMVREDRKLIVAVDGIGMVREGCQLICISHSQASESGTTSGRYQVQSRQDDVFVLVFLLPSVAVEYRVQEGR